MNLYGLLDAIINKVNRAVKVEKQELDSPLQKQARENINVPSKNEVCNPNLLDNWYFLNPVNQRGQTSYTNGYGIDRWCQHRTISTVSLSDSGVTITDLNNYEAGFIFDQDSLLKEQLVGKQVTVSLLVSEVSGNVAVQCGGGAMWITSVGLHSFTVDSYDNSDNLVYLLRLFNAEASSSITLIAAKVELGDTQTLAHQDFNGNWVLNEVPKYSEELLKCRQYDPYTGEYIGLKKFSQSRNLLDNSNFRKPINQRGSTNHTGTGYWIDRWCGDYDGASFSIDANGITIFSGHLQQWLPDKHSGKTLTLAACNVDGVIEVSSCTVSEVTGSDRWLCTSYFDMFLGIMQTHDGKLLASISKNASSAPIIWAALYEGAYTLETLPEYKSKKYEEELLVCRQYDPYTGEYIGLRKFSQSRNLLDNSDFRNPVNQRGFVSGNPVGHGEYFIDRWFCYDHSGSGEVINVHLDNQGVTFKSPDTATITQIFPDISKYMGKTLTLAIGLGNGTILTASDVAPTTEWAEFSRIETDNVYTRVQIFNNDKGAVHIRAYTDITIAWIAIYEGKYTADTLPEYPSKGYNTELAICSQYNLNTGEFKGTYSMDLLWENASPDSNFQGQTIALNFSAYDFIVINTRYSVNYNFNFTNFCKIGETTNLITTLLNNSKFYISSRSASIDISGVTFGAGCYGSFGSASTTSGDNNCIPLRIYGVKGAR